MDKRHVFWTNGTIRFFILFFTACSVYANGYQKTFDFIGIVLGIYLVYKIIVFEKHS